MSSQRTQSAELKAVEKLDWKMQGRLLGTMQGAAAGARCPEWTGQQTCSSHGQVPGQLCPSGEQQMLRRMACAAWPQRLLGNKPAPRLRS